MEDKYMNIKEANDNEYLELRRELARISITAHKYRMTLYSVVSLILAYLLSRNERPDPLVFLIPIPIIIGFYLANINLIFNTYYLGSYLNAFSGEYNFKWEKRTNYMRMHKLGKYKYTEFNRCSFFGSYQYLILSLLCIFIYFVNVINHKNNICIYITIGIISTLLSFAIFKKIPFHDYMNEMIADWGKCKDDNYDSK